MLLDLSGVLSEQHTAIDETVSCTLEMFQSRLGKFPVSDKDDVHIQVTHVKGHRYKICGTCRIVLEIPCDRCLMIVPTEFRLDFTKNVELGTSREDEEQAEDLDETNYIDGYTLDIDKLICEEILIGWPTKILCSEDCKGICNVCGQNLNQGTCNCEDTGLDPRMSVIRDVFKNFKEV